MTNINPVNLVNPVIKRDRIGGTDPVKQGFYYTLYGGQSLTALPETGTAYRAEPCDVEGKVVFPAVAKPSDAAGFFTIGVSATREK